MGVPKSMSMPLSAGHFQPARIQAHLMQDRRVNIGDVVAILHGVKAQFIGRSVSDPALHAATGHPDAEAVRMMIAAIAVLRARRAAELRAQTTSVSSSKPRCFRSLK